MPVWPEKYWIILRTTLGNEYASYDIRLRYEVFLSNFGRKRWIPAYFRPGSVSFPDTTWWRELCGIPRFLVGWLSGRNISSVFQYFFRPDLAESTGKNPVSRGIRPIFFDLAFVLKGFVIVLINDSANRIRQKPLGSVWRNHRILQERVGNHWRM